MGTPGKRTPVPSGKFTPTKSNGSTPNKQVNLLIQLHCTKEDVKEALKDVPFILEYYANDESVEESFQVFSQA
jgi:hypothetical protein